MLLLIIAPTAFSPGLAPGFRDGRALPRMADKYDAGSKLWDGSFDKYSTGAYSPVSLRDAYDLPFDHNGQLVAAPAEATLSEALSLVPFMLSELSDKALRIDSASRVSLGEAASLVLSLIHI